MTKENYEYRGRIHTQLSEWMSAATSPMQIELAKRCGTSVGYLRLLANVWRENPKLRFALDIVNHTNALNSEVLDKLCVVMPKVTIEGLANPTRYPSRDNTSNSRKYRCEG